MVSYLKILTHHLQMTSTLKTKLIEFLFTFRIFLLSANLQARYVLLNL